MEIERRLMQGIFLNEGPKNTRNPKREGLLRFFAIAHQETLLQPFDFSKISELATA